MQVSKANRRLNYIVNKTIEIRAALENKAHHSMELEKEKKYNKIKREYYSKHEGVLRYRYIPSNLRG